MDAIGSRQEVLSSSFMVEDSIEESAHDPQSVNTDQLPPQNLESQARLIERQFETDFGADPVHAVVKWFNPEKGFGFVIPSDGSDEAFLHGSVLARAGIDVVGRGETLEVRLALGQKGLQVIEVVSIDSSTAVPTLSSAPSIEELGTVKWFDMERGFGFIARDQGGKDVFVTISVLKQANISRLSEGQLVIVDVVEEKKGPRAKRIYLV